MTVLVACRRCHEALVDPRYPLCNACFVARVRMRATYELAQIAIPPIREPTRLERLDGEMQRCWRCDARYLPTYGHTCKRNNNIIEKEELEDVSQG